MTEKQLSEKEKALILLEKARNSFDKCSEQLSDLTRAFNDCNEALRYASRNLNRILNEEENGGNVHKNCEWYDKEKDICDNFLMGCPGLAFEVSRHNQCIEEMLTND